MKTIEFNFNLPPELIAKQPVANRSDAKMLVYSKKTHVTAQNFIKDLPKFLQAGDLLVLNNTKVIPARLFGKKQTGGAVEILVERVVDDHTFLAHIRASKAPKAGAVIMLLQNYQFTIVNKQHDLYLCHTALRVLDLLEHIGQIPLPPYIDRIPTEADLVRYQTVYAKHQGSVAAPTAGLHLTEELLTILIGQGVELAYTTLHIGAGTFQPVRTEFITQHKMHTERYFITQQLIAALERAQASKNRIIAVGTTALRSLESFANLSNKQPGCYETDIFIYPEYKFKLCDGLLTNFHLPQSTLLMLVAAFIGKKEALALYQHAVAAQYRFFSYGDACLFL